jgi:hypothetical protein
MVAPLDDVATLAAAGLLATERRAFNFTPPLRDNACSAHAGVLIA